MAERVAVYTRVSTEDQAKEGFSLKAQAARLRDFARAHGWTVVSEYVDEGHSGRNARRPAYQRMLSERDSWDRLLVVKMDRIHRNSKNFIQMMEDFSRWEKRFTSMQESFDTGTAMGRFVMDIIQRIAQLESEQIGERVYMGMSQKASEGQGILGFSAPTGYRFRDGALETVPSEAKLVHRIFQRYQDGDDTATIAGDLNREGVRTRAGAEWRRDAIVYIFHNPVYAGLLGWDRRKREVKVYVGEHEPVVPLEEFNAVQRRLQSRQRNPAYRKRLVTVSTAAGDVAVLVKPEKHDLEVQAEGEAATA